MPQLVAPHGTDSVKPLLLPETERAEEAKRAARLKKVPLDTRAVSDIFMLAMGAYTPLDGFMGHDDWRGSCVDMRMKSGVFWPIHITLPVKKDIADAISQGEEVALADGETGDILAIMEVTEKYSIDRQLEAQRQSNERLRARNAALDAEVRDLKTGYDAIEERARSELGMIRQDEVFFRVLDSAQSRP